jgi:hypothetical protein
MAKYIVPQVLINQLISEVSMNTIKNQNVLVIGPNYELFRFTEADEKQKCYIGDYTDPTGQEGGGTVVDEGEREYSVENGNAYANVKLKVDNLAGRVVIPYPGQASTTIPDANYTKVFADEVIIKLASLGSFYFLDDKETAGLDARLRFPFALAGDKRGFATKYVCRCYVEPTDGKCVDGCGKDLQPYFAISWADDYVDPTGALKPGQMKNFPRSINPGDAIRIPYVGTDGAAHVYKSTIVEVFESVKESGIFDSVQLADTLPDDFPKDTVTIPADPTDKYSIAYETEHFTAVEDNTIHPVYPWDPGECDSNDLDSNDDGTDILGAVQLCAQFSDVEISRKTGVRHVWNWDTYADTDPGNDEDIFGVVISGNLKARYSNWDSSDPVTGLSPEYRVLSARLFVQHRDLIVSSAGDITSIASHTLVEQTLGKLHPDNPLAFGVYMAALNSGDRIVYYCGIPTDDLSGYNVALGKATMTDDVYFIVPLSGDEMVVDSVKAHVEEMSTAENKLWRVGFVSQTPPKIDMIYDQTNNPSKEDFYVQFKLAKGRDWYTDGANLIQFMKDEDIDDDSINVDVKCLKDVKVGDVVKIWLDNSDDDWDETPHYTERYVKKIVSNSVLQLAKPVYLCAGEETIDDGNESNDYCYPDMIPNGKTRNHFKVEVYRKLTATQQVQYIADMSSSLATRRMYNVFPSVASTDGIVFTGEFLAAAAAGLASSVLPQQPLTNVELNGVGDLPIVYQTYTREQLNTIAAGGTFIIMQERPGSQVYVRHQISTDYTSNNLLKAELSITKNLDSISYYFAELFAPMIGKYNITPELIGVLRVKLEQGLRMLETSTAAGLYGPQVLAEGTEILELHQDEVHRDHVYAKVHLNLPVPFNYFDLDLEI